MLVQKSPGYISELEKKLERTGSHIGISHTRWATHGVPNEINAHPHENGDGSIAVIHNGIIDNHLTLKERLIEKGHKFRSQTDSEVIPHLIEKHWQNNPQNTNDMLTANTLFPKLPRTYSQLSSRAPVIRILLATYLTPAAIAKRTRDRMIAPIAHSLVMERP